MNPINSQINLFRCQTTVNKENAHSSILKIAKAISVSRKAAFTFILCILTSHDNQFVD